jgi:hypothetical protein
MRGLRRQRAGLRRRGLRDGQFPRFAGAAATVFVAAVFVVPPVVRVAATAVSLPLASAVRT